MIDPTDDKRAYLDRSLETPMTKGYEEGCMTLLLIMLSMLLHPLMSIAPLLLLMSSIPLSLLVCNSPILLLGTMVAPLHL